MNLTTDKEKLHDMIDTSSIRGQALMLLLLNGPLTASEMSLTLNIPSKSLSSNLNTIKQDNSYIELKITKNQDRKNVYEFIGLYKSMSSSRRQGDQQQPIGFLERSFQAAFALMNTTIEDE
ncbi:hypothetical protein AB6D40_022575 [Vibrio cyclitrophicus]|jgi:DNA-binding transcriptional regulator GbsR (MarR family)